MNITKSNRVDMILGVRSQATVTFKDIFWRKYKAIRNVLCSCDYILVIKKKNSILEHFILNEETRIKSNFF
jgi:hypothetical protein